jgi:uncharacterized protein
MRKIYSTFLIFLFFSFSVFAVWTPEKPVPPRLVNDLAGMLNPIEVQTLEQKLVEFANRTTTQIVIVTVPSLNGEDKAMVATEIIHTWGIGQQGKDNGIVILIKPKTIDSKGEVQIATGYGLEGVIPDAIAKRIVENEIIPKFKQNNFSEGIDNAVNVIMQLSLGEFSAQEYAKKTKKEAVPGGIFFLVVLLFFIFNFIGRARNVGKRSIGRNIPFWVLLSMLGSSGSSRGHGDSWGGFSSGSGGFGGFGGGSGGGGAGGSW